MTDFADAVQLTADGPLRWRAELPADWGQGRTMFGGLVAVLALSAAQQTAGPQRPVRSLDIAFVAPLPPGPAVVTAQVLSQGRSATQLTVDVHSGDLGSGGVPSGGVLGARVLVVAGTARPSGIAVPGPSPLAAPGVPEQSGVEFPFLPGVTPAFIQNVEMRWCGPAFPFTGAGPEAAVTRAWVRHRTPATGVGAALALLDAAPPMVLPMASGPMPGSTIRWAAHLLEPALLEPALLEPALLEPALLDAAGAGWFWLEGETLQARDGYAVEHSRLYSGGVLVAWAEQLVAVYDKRAAT